MLFRSFEEGDPRCEMRVPIFEMRGATFTDYVLSHQLHAERGKVEGVFPVAGRAVSDGWHPVLRARAPLALNTRRVNSDRWHPWFRPLVPRLRLLASLIPITRTPDSDHLIL